jgi:hypothetical protein
VYLLRVSDPDATARVCEFFRRAHVDVREQARGLLSASIPGAASSLHEWREITGYVTTWNALNPASPVELLDAAD